RLRSVRERVRTFHDRTYRAYLRAVLRERAERLRSAQQGFEAASEALRAARTALEEGGAEAARLGEELGAAQADLQRLEGEERGLVTSAAWASVAEVEQLRERAAAQDRAAQAREEAATDAAALAGALEAELIASEAAL